MSYIGALQHFSTLAGMEIKSDNAVDIVENIGALIENNKLSKNQLVSLEGLMLFLSHKFYLNYSPIFLSLNLILNYGILDRLISVDLILNP